MTPSDDDGEYGVETTPEGMVRVSMGPIPAFEMDPQTAIKFGSLLLRKAGVDFTIDRYEKVQPWPRNQALS